MYSSNIGPLDISLRTPETLLNSAAISGVTAPTKCSSEVLCNLSMEVDAVTPGGAGGGAPAWFPPPQPIVPAAEAIERAAASAEPPAPEEPT